MSAVERILEEVKRVSGEDQGRGVARVAAGKGQPTGLSGRPGLGRLRCRPLCRRNLHLAPARAKGRLSSGAPLRRRKGVIVAVTVRHHLSDSEQDLLECCRDLIRQVIPEAKVILYGSRARGDAKPESDYDLLVLTKEPVNWHIEDAIREKLYTLELETGAVFSIAAFSEEEWNSPLYQAMPFSQNVRREGIIL